MTTITDEQRAAIKEREAVMLPPRKEGAQHEIWRYDYKTDAYADQTGRRQGGYVVYEQLVVVEIGRYDQYEWYGNSWCEAVDIAAVHPETGRAFKGHQNVVDYWGGMLWIPDPPLRDDQPGGYRTVSKHTSLQGYCYPNGTAPVTRLLA